MTPEEHKKRLDLTREFLPVRIAVLTVSDTRTSANDTSGDALCHGISDAGHKLAERMILPDDCAQITAQLKTWIADQAIDVVLVTGGTGLTGRDVTPEAFCALGGKEIVGFGELFRMISYAKIGTSTMQSRAMGLMANQTYLFALPGSTGACRCAWRARRAPS